MAINSVSTPQISFTNTTGAARGAAPAAATANTPAAPGDAVTLSGGQSVAAAPEKLPQWKVDGPVEPITEPLAPKKWTVMVWSASDNNLYSFMQDDINEAERVGSTPLMNVIVQTDHAQVGGGGKIYELQADSQDQLHSPVRADLGVVNMGDPKALSEFIQWTMKNYPAENYMLVMSDHGGGWNGACQDEGSDGWMTPGTIQDGLRDAREKTGKKIDVLGFDACLMASAEVAQQLKDECSFLVGSEEVEGGAGWQYDQTLTRKSNRVFSGEIMQAADTAMRSRVDFTPKEFATNIVTMAQGHQGDLGTMSAFDSEKVQGLTDAVKNFGQAILDSKISAADLKAAKRATQGFYEYKDLGDFATKIAAKAGDNQGVKDAAAAVQAAIGEAIVAEQHSTKYPGASGVTIELDKKKSAEEQSAGFAPVPNIAPEKAARIDFGTYGALDFAKQTNWQAVQAKINQKVAGEVAEVAPGAGGLGGLTAADIEALLGELLAGLQAATSAAAAAGAAK